MYCEHVTPIVYKNVPKVEEKNDPVTPQSSAQKLDKNLHCSLHENKLSNLLFKQVPLT